MTIDEAIKVAEAATPGPWTVKTGPRHSPDACDLQISGDIFLLADINGPQYPHQEANAAFMAKFDPPTVLALLRFVQAWDGLAEAGWDQTRERSRRVHAARAAVDEALKD